MSSYLDTIYEEASKEFELPTEDIKFIYESMFGFIHDTISGMPFLVRISNLVKRSLKRYNGTLMFPA